MRGYLLENVKYPFTFELYPKVPATMNCPNCSQVDELEQKQRDHRVVLLFGPLSVTCLDCMTLLSLESEFDVKEYNLERLSSGNISW